MISRPERAAAAVAISLSAVILAAACGNDSDFDAGLPEARTDEVVSDEEREDFAEAYNDAIGAGGGGTLQFDGAKIPIDSAICVLDGPRIEVGTVGQKYRVLVSGDRDDLDLQILDPEGIQWFDGSKTPGGPPGGQATIEGNVVTGAENVWWNNQDDREITASFTLKCP